jgi:spermidine/putrescine transport system permease protein
MERSQRLALLVLTGPVVAFVGLFCLAPLVNLFAYSFFQVDFVAIVRDPTLANYGRVLSSETYLGLILKAIRHGALVALFTAVLGYPLAFFIAKRVSGMKSVFLTAMLIPLYTGDLVRIFAWRVVLGAEGVLNSFLKWIGLIDEPIWALLFSPAATLLVLTYTYLPFMVLGLWLSLEALDNRLLEAANDLGASRTQTFLRVMLPLTLPGFVAGGLMVFTLVAGDYLTPQLVGGSSGVTIISAITDLFGAAFDWPLGSAIAWMLLAGLVSSIVIVIALLRQTPWGRALFRVG